LYSYQEKKGGAVGAALFRLLYCTGNRLIPMKLFNRNFYRFLFGFVAIIAGTLALVLIVGVVGN